MAFFTGVNGVVTIPTLGLDFVATLGGTKSAVGQITRWELTVRRDIHDDGTFSDSAGGGKIKRGGMYDGVFTIEGFMEASKTLSMPAFSTIDQAPTAGFQLKMDATKGFAFAGIFSDFTLSQPRNGIVTFRATGESSGEITELPAT